MSLGLVYRRYLRPLRPLRYPFAVIALCASYFWVLQLIGNFHTVVPGELYRSAQISPKDVPAFKEKYGIKTIINLRGSNSGKPWYDNEVQAAHEQGITHLDFRMSARKDLQPDDAKKLVEMMRMAEKPLLIHCNAGADRSGLASALYLAVVENAPGHEAERQLWPIYGHLPLPFIKEYAMDRSFESLQSTFGYTAEPK